MITFKADGKTLLIGGQESLGAGGKGLTGPFPRYSISREDVTTGTGVYLHSKFSINVTGTATMKSGDDQDITVVGQRQNRIQGEALIAMHMNRQSWPTIGNGLLTISSYGGLDNDITFDNARITSLELPEQNEESAGVQNLEYAFTFEATSESSGAAESSGDPGATEAPDFLLSSVEETWEVTLNEGQGAFANNHIAASAPPRSYTMTHAVSATGSRKMNGANLHVDGEAWRQASQYVETRLVSDDPLTITDSRSNIVNGIARNAGGEFAPRVMDKNGVTDLGLDLNISTGEDKDKFKAYNHIRTWSNNQGEGSCAVTETWLISGGYWSEAASAVTHDVDISLDISQDAPANSVTISGTIQGLNTGTVSSSTEDKYTNAQAALSDVMANAYSAANTVYVTSALTGTLRTAEINKSLGHNKVTGTITWSVTYDDLVVTIPGAITEDINITYDNTDAGNQLIAIIGVIDNAGGPVIQNMNTTNEQKTSVSIDATMDKSHRTSPPTSDAQDIALGYIPTGGFRESRSETWNPKSGQYNYSISWVATT